MRFPFLLKSLCCGQSRAAGRNESGALMWSASPHIKRLTTRKELRMLAALRKWTLGQLSRRLEIPALKAENRRLRTIVKKNETRLDSLIHMVGALYMRDAQEGSYTPQEKAWFGKHGFRYIIHHLDEDWERTRVPVWETLLGLIPQTSSVCEFGANIGANLKAIRHLRPDITLMGIELNPVAVELLRGENLPAKQGSIANADLGEQFDLVFSRGVLIHIKPADLDRVLQNMAVHSRRYVLIYENFSEQMHSLDRYAKAVTKTTGLESEGYQFWGDFSREFQSKFPAWTVIGSGVDLKVGQAPADGDLFWTIFERPNA
jgi:hypothetical protein